MRDNHCMPKRSSNPMDVNQLAAEIVQQATSGAAPTGPEPAPKPTKDPLAVELGRRGGLKGGPARAKKLSKKRKVEIAQKAARARWASKK